MRIYNDNVGAGYGNTGHGGKGFKPGKVTGLIIMPDNKSYSNVKTLTDPSFKTLLLADCIAALPENRIYPILDVIDYTGTNAEDAVQNSNYGFHRNTEKGRPSFDLLLPDVGLRLLQEIYQFSGNKRLRAFTVHGQKDICGQKTAAGLFVGFSVDIDTNNPKFPEGTNLADHMIHVSLNEADAIVNKAKFEYYPFATGTVLKDVISGCHPVELTVVSASPAAIVVKAQLAESDYDLGRQPSYEAALELPAAWLPVLAESGAALVPASVTYSSSAGTFTLAAPTSPGTWATALHYLSLVSPAALAALSSPMGNGQTGGFESNVVAVTPA